MRSRCSGGGAADPTARLDPQEGSVAKSGGNTT
jgi:hypothetical protein